MSSLLRNAFRRTAPAVDPVPTCWVPQPDERTSVLPLTVEDWPRQHDALVPRMCAIRPGLTADQAYAALQALRTLGVAIHEGGTACPTVADTSGECAAMTTGVLDTPLSCARGAHGDDWHQDRGGTRWRDSYAGGTRIHGADTVA